MRIIQPSVEFVSPVDGVAVLKRIEKCGRVCYQSDHLITNRSYTDFAKMILRNGHESVLEHASFSLSFICDRGITHEIVRHRIASYSQESTRYCNYAKKQFNAEITVIEPCFLQKGTDGYSIWEKSCMEAEEAYFNLLNYGCTAQEARAVLPTCLKSQITMTANIREWRHFFKLRCSPAAHPQMREVANMALQLVCKTIPVLFDDIGGDEE